MEKETKNTDSVSSDLPKKEDMELAPKISKPRARKTVKPLVEGINAPIKDASAPLSGGSGSVVAPKVVLTNSEKKLIDEQIASVSAVMSTGGKSDPVPFSAAPKAVPFVAPPMQSQKIMLPSKKSSGSRKIVWSILFSLLAVSVVLGAFLWYQNQSGDSSLQFLNIFPKHAVAPVTSQQPTANPPVQNTDPVIASTTPEAVTPVATSTPPGHPSLKQVKVLSTPTGYLNVRSTPSTSGKLLGKVSPGEIYLYTNTQTGWYQITLSDGSTGWVTAQYVQIIP